MFWLHEINKLSDDQKECVYQLVRIMNREPQCSPLRAINDAFSLIEPKRTKTMMSCIDVMTKYNRIKDAS